jgi:predicted PurR-regulated permease PerM
MGALIGLLTFAILTVYRVGQFVQDPGSYRQAVDNSLREFVTHNPNPEAAQMAQSLSTTTGLALLIVIAMGLVLGVMLVVGGVSGALAASLARNKPGP